MGESTRRTVAEKNQHEREGRQSVCVLGTVRRRPPNLVKNFAVSLVFQARLPSELAKREREREDEIQSRGTRTGLDDALSSFYDSAVSDAFRSWR